MATAQEIAVAYVSLTPSMRGTQGAIAKEFAGVERLAARTSQRMGSTLSQAFDTASRAASKTVKVVGSVASEAGKVAANLSRGFKTGDIDGFSASLGALGKTGVDALTKVGRAGGDAFGKIARQVPGVEKAFSVVRDLAGKGVQSLSSFAAGFQSPAAAASAFTGQMGTLGGKTRDVLDTVILKTKGLAGSITAPAHNFIAGFKAMNGGAMEFSGVMGNIGATVGNTLSPVINVVKNIGGAVKQAANAFAPALGPIKDFAAQAVQTIAQIPGKIADTFQGPATAAVTAGIAAIGVALGKGLGRMSSLDQATAKLRGLGYQGKEVAQIMSDATEAVTGTAYGLDEAATVAAGAMAAQIKPGKQLEQHLKNVANNAAAAGVSMEDMGSLFNKAATQANGVQNNIIGQLADKGIPIYEELGKQMGVTAGEVFSLASQGKVSFEMFSAAATAAAGTVADEMGNTVTGSLKNFFAAVGRIGANVLGGINKETGEMYGLYAQLVPVIQAATGALKPLEEWAKQLGVTLSEKVGPILEKITGWLQSVGSAGDGLKGKLSGVLSAVAPLGAAFGVLGLKGLAPLLTKIPLVGGLLGPLPKMLGAIGGPAGIAAAGLLALAQVDPAVMAQGFEDIAAKLPGIIGGLLGKVVQVATEIVPSLLRGIVDTLPVLVQGLTGLVQTIVDALVGALPVLMTAGTQMFMGLIDAVVAVAPDLMASALGVVTLLVGTLVEQAPMILDGAITMLMGLVDGVLAILPDLLAAVVGLIPVVVDALITLLPTVVSGAVELFLGIVQAVIEIVPDLLAAIVGLLPEIIGSLLSLIPALLDGAVQLFLGIVTALPEIIPDLIQAVVDLGPVLVQAVIDLIPLLFQAGKDLLGGLIDGIKDMAGGAVEAIKGVGGKMLDGIKGFFGIKSPSKVMADIGGYLDSGLAGGLGKGASSVAAMTATSKQITLVTDNLKKSVTATANAVGQQVNAIIASLQKLVSMMSGAFKNGVTSQLTAVARLFQTVVPNAAKLMQSQTQNSLKGLQTWVGGSFKSTLVTAVNAIKAAFVAVPGAVSSSWSRIKSGTAAPSNYVISTVYMNGIRSAVNSIAKAVGVSATMPAVKSIGYATGGVLPGYTPGRDIYDFYSPQFGKLSLSGGEAILRPEVTKALGGAATINAWNASRGRGISAIGDRGYANGGILDFLKKGANGWSVNTSPMDFQFQALDKPKDTIKQLVANPAIEYAQRAGGGQFGQSAGAGFTNIAGAYAAVFAKAVEKLAGGGTGLVASARKALGVPYVWGGSSIPPGLDCSGLVYWAYQQMGKTSVPRLTAAGYQNVAMPVAQPRAGDVAFWGNPAHHIAIMTGPGSIVHAPKPGDVVRNAGLYGNPTFGRLKYDQGGMLPPGLTLVENRTGKPEPVFTSEQFESMRGGVRDVYFQIDVSQLRDLTEAADLFGTLDRRIRMGVA